MIEIGPENAVSYLCSRGWLDPHTAVRADLLAWGVSNVVLRITPNRGEAFVIKQSREQLRTQDPWFSRLDRIWRETAALKLLQPLLPQGAVPQVLFEDRENFVLAMEAAPADHIVWKQSLLEGRTDVSISRRLGTYLAAIHRQTAQRADLSSQFGDTEVFLQLRVDPFYRRIAAVDAKAAPHIEALIAEMFSHRLCMVHADFSPKNVLIAGERIVLVDFETVHYGDPAFDLGFFLSHLMLKSIRHAPRFTEFAELTSEFWACYLHGLGELSRNAPFAPADLVRRTVGHLAGCMWARIDGTSRIDYLDEAQQDAAREFCRGLFDSRPGDWNDLLSRLQKTLRERRLDTHEINPRA